METNDKWEIPQRLQLFLVPKETELKIEKKGKMNLFHFIKKGEQPDFDFLKGLVESIPNAENDKEGPVMPPFEQDCYWLVKVKNGIIQFEINHGRKEALEGAPVLISMRTNPAFPSPEFLEEIRQLVKSLIKKSNLKLFELRTLDFVEPDNII